MNWDETFMQRCLELAQLGQGNIAPNPMVGSVIVFENKIIGEGFHQNYGEAHAEVNAINSVTKTEFLNKSTIYINLEPCAHHGKTPPCVDLILEKQLKRVVIGCRDSFHEVDGKSIEKLQQHGIEVLVGVLEKDCIELNKRFFTFHTKKRPYIILKWAQTQDGFIDKLRKNQVDPEINWISSPETQTLVHFWRSQEQAILVGRKTVNNDNPSLTVREVIGKNPIRIIIDKNLQANPKSKIFTDGNKTIILNALKNEKRENVHFLNVENLNLECILTALYQQQIQSVIVEGGKETLEHFISNGLWDEARIIIGNTKFENGIKAPGLAFVPKFSQKFSNDEIYYYFRP